MAVLLIGRKDEDLANPFPLLDGSNFKDILGQNPHKYMSALMVLENNIILPFLCLLINETDSINVKEEQYFKSHFVRNKLVIISLIFVDFIFFTTSFIFMHFFSFRDLKIFLRFLTLQEIVFLVEEHPPSVVVNEILTILFTKNIGQILDVLAG